jgi:hypothetical protein
MNVRPRRSSIGQPAPRSGGRRTPNVHPSPGHFFVVGAQRSGTTYLYRVLDEHPAVAMARPVWPEPKFFFDDDQYRRGLGWYRQTYFAHAADGQLRGEKSVGYLESDTAAERILAAIPDAPIVVILRNPVDRAVSNYRFSLENGLETLSIEEALFADEQKRAIPDGEWFIVDERRIGANPFAYRRRGHYVEDLRRYANRFGRDQMHVMVFEDTIASGSAVAELYEFLGIDPGIIPPTLGSVVNAAHGSPSDLAPPLRRELEAHFAPWNAALADEFDLDLTAWTPFPE